MSIQQSIVLPAEVATADPSWDQNGQELIALVHAQCSDISQIQSLVQSGCSDRALLYLIVFGTEEAKQALFEYASAQPSHGLAPLLNVAIAMPLRQDRFTSALEPRWIRRTSLGEMQKRRFDFTKQLLSLLSSAPATSIDHTLSDALFSTLAIALKEGQKEILDMPLFASLHQQVEEQYGTTDLGEQFYLKANLVKNKQVLHYLDQMDGATRCMQTNSTATPFGKN